MAANGRTPRWTPDQARAIETVDRTVLVSASAGTGKTAVLTERVARLLADPHRPVDVGAILVVTFTEAAAEEMKSRIGTRLRDAWQRQRSEHLYAQLLRLDGAQISTIHAFCKRILEEYFEQAGLEPGWDIIDADAAALLKRRVLDEVIDSAWRDAQLAPGMEILFGGGLAGHQADRLIQRVIDLSEFLDTQVGRADWFERAAQIGQWTRETALIEADRVAYLRRRLTRMQGWCRHGLVLDQRLADGHWHGHIEQYYGRPIREWIEALDTKGVEPCIERIRTHTFKNFPRKPKSLRDEEARAIKTPFDEIRKTVKALQASVLFAPAYAAEYEHVIGSQLGVQARTLVELTRRFDAAWAQAKRQRGVLDFAGLEQHALEMLERSDDVVGALRNRFRYVFVDEVQDINTVQQRILDCVSRPDNVFAVGDVKQSIYGFRGSRPQLFLERLSVAEPTEPATQQAEPEVAGVPKTAAPAVPLRVDLRHSFRSQPAVLAFVNRLFERIMREPVAGMDYDRRARLAAGRDDQDGPSDPHQVAPPNGSPDTDANEPVVELVILDAQPDEDEQAVRQDGHGNPTADHDDIPNGAGHAHNGAVQADGPEDTMPVSARQCQAVYIAARIRQMVEGAGHQDARDSAGTSRPDDPARMALSEIGTGVGDDEASGRATAAGPMQICDPETGRWRPVRYGDIAVLMRSPAKRARDFVEVFRQAGIPVSSDSSEGFFAATEIMDMLALLKTLDNPRDDIELAAVLRSRLIGLTDADLAQIRLQAPPEVGPRLHDALCWYARCGADRTLKARTAAALDRLNRWRLESRTGSLADLIWRVYRQTGYLAFVSALPGGRQRRANLLMLHDRAVQFEHAANAWQGGATAHFVAFIERLLEGSQDWAPAPADTAENAVRILSVHRSKGLEFPVVFLAELHQPFNREDTFGPCLFDEDLLLGFQVWPQRNCRIASRPYELIAEKRRVRALAEEMRILYVAMTRAREKLVLCATEKRRVCASRLAEATPDDPDTPVNGWLLETAGCMLDWVLWGLADVPCVRRLFGVGTDGRQSLDRFSATLVPQGPLETATRRLLARPNRPRPIRVPADGPTTRTLQAEAEQTLERLAWIDPHAAATRLPAKTSVTELTHRGDEFALFAALPVSPALAVSPGSPVSAVSPGSPTSAGSPQPAPAPDHDEASTTAVRIADIVDRQTARRRGTVMHRLIEELPLPGEVTTSVIRETLGRLVHAGAIDAEDAAAIDTEAVAWCFSSDPCRLACLGRPVLREWPFTMGLDAGHIDPAAAGELTVVQGIVDMIIRTPEGLVVVDFKTDRIGPDQAERLAQRVDGYRDQVDFYCQAAQSCLKTPVTAAWLVFLHPRQALRIEPRPHGPWKALHVEKS